MVYECCLDSCNLPEFEYDDFDCCLEFINDEECSDCLCHLDGTKHNVTECTQNMLFDNICQRECNSLEYDYDNGDCCKIFVQTLAFQQIICHETGGSMAGKINCKKMDKYWENGFKIGINWIEMDPKILITRLKTFQY